MCNETTELVPPLPDKEAQARLVQIVVGGGAALMALLMVIRLLFGSSSKGDKKKAGATPAAAKANGKPGDEWLAGTVSSSGLLPPPSLSRCSGLLAANAPMSLSLTFALMMSVTLNPAAACGLRGQGIQEEEVPLRGEPLLVLRTADSMLFVTRECGRRMRAYSSIIESSRASQLGWPIFGVAHLYGTSRSIVRSLCGVEHGMRRA